MLKISDTLSLPIGFVTQTQAILAKRGAGKSYTASVQAEEMLKANQQVVVIDPTGAWYGLRSSADGKGEGFPIVVMGGDHADVPLQPASGELVAQAIVENRFSAIIDISLFRKAEARRFLIPFLETLYRMNREPMHLFVDEADDIAPQKPFGDEAQLVGAMEDVIKRGRRKGIGCTLITQRPADLNKSVLTQCQILTALRMTHPKDINAIKEWVGVHGDPEQAHLMIDSLPPLPTGIAWFWSPGWPDAKGYFQQVEIRKRQTFDSGATPKPGEKARAPKVVAKIDLVKLGAAIAETAVQAKANDPKELKSKIADLEKHIVTLNREKAELIVKKTKEVPLISADDRKVLERLSKKLNDLIDEEMAGGELTTTAWRLREKQFFGGACEGGKSHLAEQKIKNNWSQKSPKEILADKITVDYQGNVRSPFLTDSEKKLIAEAYEDIGRLSDGERKVLTAVYQYHAVTRERLSILCGYKRSTRDAYLQRLQSNQLIIPTEGGFGITDDGLRKIRESKIEPLPTGNALRQYWHDKLPPGESQVLAIVIVRYPEPIAREELSIETGFSRSTRDAYLQRLAARQLIKSVGRGEVVAAKELFD